MVSARGVKHGGPTGLSIRGSPEGFPKLGPPIVVRLEGHTMMVLRGGPPILFPVLWSYKMNPQVWSPNRGAPMVLPQGRSHNRVPQGVPTNVGPQRLVPQGESADVSPKLVLEGSSPSGVLLCSAMGSPMGCPPGFCLKWVPPMVVPEGGSSRWGHARGFPQLSRKGVPT